MRTDRSSLSRYCFTLLLACACAAIAIPQDAAPISTPASFEAPQAADDTLTPMLLSLNDVVEMALDTNLDIRLADLAFQEATAAIGEAKAADRVLLDFAASYSRLGPVSSIEMPGTTPPVTITTGTDRNWMYGVDLYKSIYSSGRNRALVTLAMLNVDATELAAAVTRRQILLAATTMFYGVTRAASFVDVAADTVANAREHWQLAAARYEAGAVPRFDVMRAEVEVANAEQQLIIAETAVETAKSVLKTLLHIDVTRPIELTAEPLPATITVEPQISIETAYRNRQELEVGRKQIQLALTNKRLARAGRGLNLDLVGGYDRQSSGGLGGGDYAWNLTLSATKSITDGGASRSKEAQALQQAEQARTLLTKLYDDIAQEVWQAYLDLQQADSRLTSTAKTVELAEEALRIAEVRYEAGIATPVEITDARLALTGARTNHVDAIYGYRLAQAQLASAVNVSTDTLATLADKGRQQH